MLSSDKGADSFNSYSHRLRRGRGRATGVMAWKHFPISSELYSAVSRGAP